jgi:nucleoside-diphosphate-sugar epimerase
MARALIVGCGCRGRELGAELAALGWLVRGTTRRQSGLGRIEAAGIEARLADPDRPGTVLELCGDVAVLVWLLGSASAGAERVAAIHGPRLERLLERLVDSPVRGFVYEAAGTVDPSLLEQGRGIVEGAGERWRIPVRAITTAPDDSAWASRAAAAVAGLLAG